MKAIDTILEQAKRSLQHIVLPEGTEPRIIQAAEKIALTKIAKITVIGPVDKVKSLCGRYGVNPSVFSIINPADSKWLNDFVSAYLDMRNGKKAVNEAKARQVVLDEIGFSAMMVRCGLADGFVAGAVHVTADVCRAVFQIIGTMPGIKTASAFSLMQLSTNDFGSNGALIFADTGVIPNPSAEQLADIAVSSARSTRALLNVRPKVAMISFSTKGSAKHPMLQKIIQATEQARKQMKDEQLEADIDGEMQIDAALIPSICLKKAPGSPIAGKANTLVFPDLNVGNSCYKLLERICHAGAYGPVLQGLKKPASDLSRGCSVDDIVNIVAIVACQSIMQKQT